jgi:glycerophosphoryl diester phosphodiesterase
MEKYPENTLSAISAALEAGACMVEFDVQMDANEQLVVLHDDSFKRTAGVSRSVFKQQGYAGISVHEPVRFADAFNPEPVPMLKQVVELLTRYHTATAFVEIKDESIDQWGMEKVVDKVLACVEPVKHQCVIIADSLDALLYTRNSSDHKIGWVIHRYDDSHRERADQQAPDYLICNYKRISGDPWPGSWQWMLYDISDPELAMKWAQKGVELIETRDIGGMLQHPLLQQRACNHVVVQN